jgi:hypothetical protein
MCNVCYVYVYSRLSPVRNTQDSPKAEESEVIKYTTPLQSTVGRPITNNTPSGEKKRKRYHESKIHGPRKCGRPKSDDVKNEPKAKQQRVARMFGKGAEIQKEASRQYHLLLKRNPESFMDAFEMMPGTMSMECARHVGTSREGKKLLPDIAKSEGDRQMFEQMGMGSAVALKEKVYGGGPLQSLVKIASVYVTDLRRFAIAIDMSKNTCLRPRKSIL